MTILILFTIASEIEILFCGNLFTQLEIKIKIGGKQKWHYWSLKDLIG